MSDELSERDMLDLHTAFIFFVSNSCVTMRTMLPQGHKWWYYKPISPLLLYSTAAVRVISSVIAIAS